MFDDNYTLDWILDYLANRTRSLREEKDITAHAMSIELGQNKAYITKIENKTAKPSFVGLFNICDFLGITLKDFFDSENMNPVIQKELFEVTKSLSSEQLRILIETAEQFKKSK